MSKEKLYHNDEWDDVPLPDEKLAWEKMELLLGKEKKRRILIPFWNWRYAATGMLFISLATGGWIWFTKKEKKTEPTLIAQQKVEGKITDTNTVVLQNKQLPQATSATTTSTPKVAVTEQTSIEFGDKVTTKQASQIIADKTTTRKVKPKKKTIREERNIVIRNNNINRQPITTKPSENNHLVNNIEKEDVTNVDTKTTLTNTIPVIISSNTKDSLAINDAIHQKAAEPVINEPSVENKKKGNGFVFSAGIGLQQAIAFSGQQGSAYNYNGKKHSLSDRIPSVYLRLQKGRWFAQAEFQYAVPQPVETFSFSQKTTYDAASLSQNIEQISLRKLYYHQLPFTVNYHVLPNWSVGTGAMYNIFAGAVTEQEITRKNLQAGGTTVNRTIAPVKGYKDSFLYKTTAGIILQSDYHWKRFSLGLRYTQNFQPFIQYTRPDGQLTDEKNGVLQVIIRFRLWKSK